MKNIALIPARSGSKRIPHKNLLELNNHPLIAYAISSALESDLFDRVIFCTDSEKYADIALHYGAEVSPLRPPDISSEYSPDIDWIKWAFNTMSIEKDSYSVAAVVRPTSPFRTCNTLRRAFKEFSSNPVSTGLKAVSICNEHPGKMWVLNDGHMSPLLALSKDGIPLHLHQKANLFEVYTQNASLDMFYIENIEKSCYLGSVIQPFFSEYPEGFDINTQDDLKTMSNMLQSGVMLPCIEKSSFNE